MKRVIEPAKRNIPEREALRKRVKQFYIRFNKADWGGCFALIDPELVGSGRVKIEAYSGSMQAFKAVYGRLSPWLTRLSLHMEGAPK